jgi:5-methylcytosine-specific restriction endonuclease McrA
VKKSSIKFHLSPYSIRRKRQTTINHAFASAIAPVDKYDEKRLDEALRLLGQDPDGELTCIYCGRPAETWDHLHSLVKDAKLSGFGHQLGNLVPCCKECNSRKGAKDWEAFLKNVLSEQTAFEERCNLITSYRDRYVDRINPASLAEKCPEDWNRYCEIKSHIINLMKEADDIAEKLREDK